MHDQRRYVDLRQVAPEVGQPGVHAGVRRVRRGPDRDGETGPQRRVADPGAAEHVGVVEVVEEVDEVGVPVGDDGRLDVLEHLPVHALGVVVGLEQERRDHAQQGGLADPARPVRPQVPDHLTGTHREADQHDVGQPEVVQQGVEVGGERVVVVPGRRLAGLAEPAPVVGDDPVPGGEQCPLLTFPGVPVQRVPVDQDDRLTLAVVLVVDLDVGVVLRAYDDA